MIDDVGNEDAQKRKESDAVEMKKHQDRSFLDMIKTLTPKYGRWQVFGDFVLMAGYAISNHVDAIHYDEREKA